MQMESLGIGVYSWLTELGISHPAALAAERIILVLGILVVAVLANWVSRD